MIMDMSTIPTYQLVQEIIKREGVESFDAEPYQDLNVPVNGPAQVIVVYD